MKRADISQAIYLERDRQNVKWGGKEHDREHDAVDWANIIDEQLDNLGEPKTYKERLIKIAALCYAALEVADLPPLTERHDSRDNDYSEAEE